MSSLFRISNIISRSLRMSTTIETGSSVIQQQQTTKGHVVLVTGGAGFLGQHIISLLQSKGVDVKEIRVYDLKPYRNILGHTTTTPVSSIVGSITDQHKLTNALHGVDSVYHVAGKISYGTFPDFKGMQSVNVEGTSNLINACTECDVRRLIFCSTVDVVIGHDDVIDGDEINTTIPSKFLFPGYPESKYKAEKKILQANGSKTRQGNILNTISLRANVMYGEGDPYYVTNGLRNAHKHGGVLYQVGDGSALFQPVYAGNTAWAFLCADMALGKNPEIGGQCYFIPDNTPVQNTFKFMKPFLEIRGGRLSSTKLPFKLVYYCLFIAETLVGLLSPLIKIELPAESYSVKYINMNLFFSNKKAREKLHYEPTFTPEVSQQRCIQYYKSLEF